MFLYSKDIHYVWPALIFLNEAQARLRIPPKYLLFESYANILTVLAKGKVRTHVALCATFKKIEALRAALARK
jgi:hypothetical protein